MNRDLHNAAEAVRRLTKKGFDKAFAIEMAVEDYGITREQLEPLLVEATGLSPDEYLAAKGNLLKAVQ